MQQLKTLDDLYFVTHTQNYSDEFIATLTCEINEQIKQHYLHHQKEFELDNKFTDPVIYFKLFLMDKTVPVEITYLPTPDEHKCNKSIQIIKYNNKTVSIPIYHY